MNEKLDIDVKTLKPFTKFIYTIGELPTSYLMSMSYEEQLVWLCNYLTQTVIPTINNNAEAVKEVQDLVLELQEYINNYFDNLDVQEEINNKLDDMAESGQLTDIIAQYLGLAGMITFDTVSDMKLATNLVNGSKAYTLGRNNVNDGGNGVYKVRTITNDDIVDDTHIIALYDNTLIAELISEEINPDNFTGTNDNQKMQNAINYACEIYANSQKTLTIKLDRVFNITSTLKINKTNKRFPLVFSGNSVGGFNISDITLLFNSDLQIVSDITFDNITFSSSTGNNLVIINSPKFINVKFLNCTFKFIDCCVFSDTYIQAFSFDNCTIAGGSGNFIECTGTYYLNINNCIIEHRVDSWLLKQNYTTETIHNKQFFTNITNNLIEGFTGDSGIIYITNYIVINITNNYFESMPNTIYHDSHEYGGSLNIENNRLFQGTAITNLNTKGFLYMQPSETNTFIIGDINFNGNTVENTYSIYFNSVQINSNENYKNYKLNYGQNYVRNSFTSTFRYKNNQASNTHFNILPIIKLTSGTSKYDRYQFNIDGVIYWTETLTVNEKNYTLSCKHLDNLFYINSQLTSEISTTSSADSMYFGVDVYNDDVVSCNIIASNCQIINFYRLGSASSKYLYLQKIKTSGDTSNVIINCNIITCGFTS